MEIVAANPDEYNLVVDAWARAYRRSPWAGTVPNKLWAEVSRTMIGGAIDSGAVVLAAVVTLEDGTRRVAGYSVSDPDNKVLYWIYVKRDFRRLGVGKRLLAETCKGDGWRYTCRTSASSRFLGPAYRWDPVPLRVLCE